MSQEKHNDFNDYHLLHFIPNNTFATCRHEKPIRVSGFCWLLKQADTRRHAA
jgi:hypothetical protein